jgi:energy-coupling factor transporter ATP-binding protein EcfA2
VHTNEAVLVTGLYGSGKSSLVAEMAERLEQADVSFGAIDVDWLTWFHLPAIKDPAPDLKGHNLAYVVDRYLSAGVERLLLAEPVRNDEDVKTVRRLVPCPVQVVRLDVRLSTIEARLGADPTSGRASDLQVARRWIAEGAGQVTADLVLDGQAPLADNATRVLTWLGWPG